MSCWKVRPKKLHLQHEVKYFLCVRVKLWGRFCSPCSPLQAVRLYKEPGRQAHFFSQMTQFSLPQVPHEKVHPIWEGNKTQQIEKQMHSSILGQKLPIRKMLRRDSWTDSVLMLQPCCFLNQFFGLWSPLWYIFTPLSSHYGEMLNFRSIDYWVTCGIPIGTLLVVGVTGAVRCRRKWKVRFMKEWKGRVIV